MTYCLAKLYTFKNDFVTREAMLVFCLLNVLYSLEKSGNITRVYFYERCITFGDNSNI